MTGKCGNLEIGYIERAGASTWDDELTPAQAAELRGWLQHALTASSSLRKVVNGIIEGGRKTFLLLTGSGETGGRPTAEGGLQIYFNPNDLGSVWQGGLFNPGGRSREQRQQADTVLAHELFHGFLSATGRADNMSPRENELAAWDFENVYRREAGLPSRDCYFKCNGDYSEDAGPSR